MTRSHAPASQVRHLPRNQSLVLNALRRGRGPRTAYELLDALRDKGFRAPLTVYRALEGLREKGLVHRIESIKAFVACCEEDHDDRPAFALCDRCGAVVEFEDPELVALVRRVSRRTGFTIERAMIELTGTCGPCAGDGRAEKRPGA